MALWLFTFGRENVIKVVDLLFRKRTCPHKGDFVHDFSGFMDDCSKPQALLWSPVKIRGVVWPW